MVVVEKEACSRLFVHDVLVSFRQTPLTRLSNKGEWSLCHILRKILANAVPLSFYI